MRRQPGSAQLPKITITAADYERLSRIANAVIDRMPDVASELLAEIERARIVKAGSRLHGVVQMGSTVEYEAEDGQRRQVRLVYPADADISAGRISILTPIGAALIGLSQGQSIDWTARDGRRHRLRVLVVEPQEVVTSAA